MNGSSSGDSLHTGESENQVTGQLPRLNSLDPVWHLRPREVLDATGLWSTWGGWRSWAWSSVKNGGGEEWWWWQQ